MNLIQRYFENLLYPENNFEFPQVKFKEALFLSWPFFIFSRFLILLSAYLVINNFSSQITNSPLLAVHPFFKNLDFSELMKLVLNFVSISIIFFPLYLFAEMVVWKITFKILLYFTEAPREEEKLELLISSSFSSYIFSIIPFIGEPLKACSQIYLLSRGLNKRFQLSGVLSLIIVLFPYFIKFGIFMTLIGIMLAMR